MKKKPSRRRRKAHYTAGEWFMVVLGVAIIILVIGIVVSTVLGE
jgi:uncharacterized membrane protein